MLALAPLLIALATALLCAFTQSSPHLQHRISLAGAITLLVCAVLLLRDVQLHGVITVVAGNSPYRSASSSVLTALAQRSY